MTNEPGITEKHRDFHTYNKIIKYKTLDTAINKILSKEYLSSTFEIFYEEIVNNFLQNYDKIINEFSNKSRENNETITTGVYNLSIKTHYNKLKSDIEKHYKYNININININKISLE